MYRVSVTREAGFWVGVVDGVPGGATEVRRLAMLDGEVRDLLAGLLDVDGDGLDLDYDFTPAPGSAATDLGHYRQTRIALEAVRSEYESAQIRTVAGLRSEGVSLRDAAELLEVSFQRVQQLA